jgi:hypothetical protein
METQAKLKSYENLSLKKQAKSKNGNRSMSRLKLINSCTTNRRRLPSSALIFS